MTKAALRSNWNALCQVMCPRFPPSWTISWFFLGGTAVFRQTCATLKLHCVKPSQTQSFTEIMRILENTPILAAAVNLTKYQSQYGTKDRDSTLTRWRILQPPKTSVPFMAVAST